MPLMAGGGVVEQFLVTDWECPVAIAYQCVDNSWDVLSETDPDCATMMSTLPSLLKSPVIIAKMA